MTEITKDAMEAAADKRRQVGFALSAILSQAKMATKRVGTAGGYRHIRSHMAAIKRQLELVAAEIGEDA